MERDGARPEAGENESHLLPCSSWGQKLPLLLPGAGREQQASRISLMGANKNPKNL